MNSPRLYFFAVPSHVLVTPQELAKSERLEPTLPDVEDVLDKALAGAEYRSYRAKDRALSLLRSEGASHYPAPITGYSPSVVFAQPPQDLPALLRLADQLESLVVREAGERALVWKCATCGTRYAVPVALVRAVSIRCDRCGSPVDLAPGATLGEEALMDPLQGVVNDARKALASFSREAMARGWPILVALKV